MNKPLVDLFMKNLSLSNTMLPLRKMGAIRGALRENFTMN